MILLYTTINKGEATTLHLLTHMTEAVRGRHRQSKTRREKEGKWLGKNGEEKTGEGMGKMETKNERQGRETLPHVPS